MKIAIPAILSLILLLKPSARARSASEIAAEKASVDSAIDSQQPGVSASNSAATPSGARPVPGEMGGRGSPLETDENAPMSLLGVVSAQTGITHQWVRDRDAVWDLKKKAQPKIDEQVKLKEQYDQEISKLDDKISDLEKQCSKAIADADAEDSRKTDEMATSGNEDKHKAIRQGYDDQIDQIRQQQDDWAKKKNDADDEIDKISHSPDIVAAEQKMEIQGARDARKYFPSAQQSPAP